MLHADGGRVQLPDFQRVAVRMDQFQVGRHFRFPVGRKLDKQVRAEGEEQIPLLHQRVAMMIIPDEMGMVPREGQLEDLATNFSKHGQGQFLRQLDG